MSVMNILIMVCILAFVCEWVDSSLGMGYGTILSPILIIIGFPVLVVVPAILISQAFGGLSASYFHHRFENARFEVKDGAVSNDLMAVIWITSLGVLAAMFASYVGVRLMSKTVLSTYIGVLVLIMGLFILIGFSFQHSVQKMVLVGLVSAFNKGLSGGGFGPLVTGGQMVLGSKHKNAIAVTTFAEWPICIAGFTAYALLNGIERWDVTAALVIGSLAASPLGAYTTMKLSKRYLREIIAILLITLGSLALLKTYGVIGVPISM